MTSSLFAQIPAGYYDSAAGQTGEQLADALHEIIDDHTRYPYTSSSTDVWDILSQADEDPANASNILSVYKNESKAKSDHTSGSGWNREHSWPSSYGFTDDGSCNYPFTDTHHLFAADWSYNSARSNKPFDNCDSGCTEWVTLNASSSNWTAGSFNTGSWEPWNDVKGDLARAMFYMAVRYNGGTHGTTGCGEPDLRLTNDRAQIQNDSNNLAVAYMGVLDTLLAWHVADPVDGFEQARNDVIFSFQGNRNPFVDHPEYVTEVFGTGNGGGGTGGGGGGGTTGDGPLWINEIHYDNVSTDAGEGVEIAGPAGTSMDGWQLVAYNGSNGAVYDTVNLSGTITDQENGFGTAWNAITGLQNGPDALALVDDQGTVIQFLSYEGSFVATDGVAMGITSTDIGVEESGTTLLGDSLQLGGTGSAYAAFTWEAPALASADAVNGNQMFPGGGGGGGTGDGALWVNEIHYDNSSTDAGEGIEIAGPAGTSMDGWQLVAYNGNGGTEYNTVNLSGTLTDISNGFGMAWYAISGLQNGAPDGIALVDPMGTVVQFLSWEGSLTATDGAASGITSTDIGVTESSSTALGFSLQLGGTGSTYSDFSWEAASLATTDAVNNNQSFTGASGGDDSLWINEIHYDNSSTDSAEGVEVAGAAGTVLDGWQLVGYNGSNGTVYATVSLSGTLADTQGGYGVAWYAISGLQNGSPDGIALVDPNGGVSQFLSYEGSLTAVDGPAATLTSDDIGVSESSSTSLGHSLQLGGTGTSYADFTWEAPATATADDVNNNQTLGDGSGGGGSGGTTDGDLWINEIHYDNSSTDVGEGVEVAGPAGTELDGWQLIAYNGNGGTVYQSHVLNGLLTDQSEGFGMIWIPITGLQNGGPDGIALIDTAGSVVQFLSWEGSFTATDGPALDITSTDIGVAETSSNPVGNSLQLGGTGSNYEDFTWQAADTATEDAVNNNQVMISDQPLANPWINEIHYDNSGSDLDEGVEIAGPANLDLSGWQLVGYNGNGGSSYNTVNLSGLIDDEGAGYGALWFSFTGLQNGSPDGVALVSPEGEVVQFLSYEGSFTANNGPAASLASDDIGVSEGSSNAIGNSMQLSGQGTTYDSFVWEAPQLNSRGDLNPDQIMGLLPPDADGDGVPDDIDFCPSSDAAATIVINGCDSGVANTVFADGCTLADMLASCAEGNPASWEYSSCVGDMTADLVSVGDLSSLERSSILDCAAEFGLPTAADDTYTTDWDTVLEVDAPGVLANDTDPNGDSLETHLFSGPAVGYLSLARDGSFSYTPEAGVGGAVSFVYKAWDGTGYRTATVTINVTVGNQRPVAQDDAYTTALNTRLVVDAPGVLVNDSDPDGDTLVSHLATNPAVGHLGFQQDGSFWYEPPLDFTGDVSFSYNLSDGSLKAPATVTIHVGN